MTNSFELFLQESFMSDEPESVRTKDTFEDDFDSWLSRLDVQELINYGEKYGKVVRIETGTMVAKTITAGLKVINQSI